MNTATKTAEKSKQSKHEEIAVLAFELWSKAGRRPGRDLEYWLEAEKQFQAGTKRHPTVQGNHIR
jgi:Protein of unknown function (DUF2934)